MKLEITSLDFDCPPDLDKAIPLGLTLLRVLPGPDRPDYWLGELDRPIPWVDGGQKHIITHIVLATRYVGYEIKRGMKSCTVGIAYVTDPSLLQDSVLDFNKCRYVVIGSVAEVRFFNKKTQLAPLSSPATSAEKKGPAKRGDEGK